MIKMSVLYPNGEGKRFDMDYYRNKHMPMVLEKLGDACKGMAIDVGLSGLQGEPAAFVVMGHLLFESMEAFDAAFRPHLLEFRADVVNYTDIQPIRLFSDVTNMK